MAAGQSAPVPPPLPRRQPYSPARTENLGVAYARLGRPDQAITTLETALRSCRDAGFRAGEAASLDSLGLAFRLLERYDDAIEHHQLPSPVPATSAIPVLRPTF
jgi:tetratricopeptide (TPR) repeat protein